MKAFRQFFWSDIKEAGGRGRSISLFLVGYVPCFTQKCITNNNRLRLLVARWIKLVYHSLKSELATGVSYLQDLFKLMLPVQSHSLLSNIYCGTYDTQTMSEQTNYQLDGC